MIDSEILFPLLESVAGPDSANQILQIAESAVNPQRWGDLPEWNQALANLPSIEPDLHLFNDQHITIGSGKQLNDSEREALRKTLITLHPWRKGPYKIHGLEIDTEWRSDLKWNRVLPHLAPLKNRRVLDVGCGNGYHMWRMLGEGASWVLGIDPTMVFFMQFLAIQKLMGKRYPVDLLPLRLEQLPANIRGFDTAFSMGVLYHRRAPIDHLYELKSVLKQGGQLVLETLVVDGDENTVLVPTGRYAQMNNVWFLPSVEALTLWLQRAGFKDIHVADVTPTTEHEQRATDWMVFKSLSDFLDPNDPSKTIEGLPGPVRATLVATSP